MPDGQRAIPGRKPGGGFSNVWLDRLPATSAVSLIACRRIVITAKMLCS
jgi:ABC-type arginine transport system permease subunit